MNPRLSKKIVLFVIAAILLNSCMTGTATPVPVPDGTKIENTIKCGGISYSIGNRNRGAPPKSLQCSGAVAVFILDDGTTYKVFGNSQKITIDNGKEKIDCSSQPFEGYFPCTGVMVSQTQYTINGPTPPGIYSKLERLEVDVTFTIHSRYENGPYDPYSVGVVEGVWVDESTDYYGYCDTMQEADSITIKSSYGKIDSVVDEGVIRVSSRFGDRFNISETIFKGQSGLITLYDVTQQSNASPPGPKSEYLVIRNCDGKQHFKWAIQFGEYPLP